MNATQFYVTLYLIVTLLKGFLILLHKFMFFIFVFFCTRVNKICFD